MYLADICIPGEKYLRRLSSLLLCWCDVSPPLITSLCVLIVHKRFGPRSVSDFAPLMFKNNNSSGRNNNCTAGYLPMKCEVIELCAV